MNGTMVDVHGAVEFNVTDDKNKRVFGVPHCVISQSTCEQLASRVVKLQTFYQSIRQNDINHCNYRIRVKDPFNLTEKKLRSKI